jgi:hypothetical protein
MAEHFGGERTDEAESNLPPLLGEESDDAVDGESVEVGEGQRSAESEKGEKTEGSDPSKKKSVSGEELSKEESAEVEKLKSRDREVRAHEQAHVAAGGQYIRGGISYDYQRGPDGRSYAVGGHVDIDISEESTPEATINKMRVVKRAALAPAEPSGADRAVAAAASSKEQQARSELVDDRQKDAVERRKKASKSEGSKASKETSDTKETKETKGGQPTEAQEGVKVEGVSGLSPKGVASTGASQAPASSAPQAPTPEVSRPRTPEMMNLARESRLRMMRGDYWLA